MLQVHPPPQEAVAASAPTLRSVAAISEHRDAAVAEQNAPFRVRLIPPRVNHAAGHWKSRSRWATAAASPRLVTPSLVRMLDTCTLAVLSLM